ncbi:type II toxin-antitoxin system HicB family antitoxin [Halobaculum sp. EA56]|uniref:type II toxin-antitoxin system HicB family antitoxin n=1 Tax=Halobaculum sp. EA56 TaxID=3421648 RepID=UPI003EBA624E
MGSFATNPSGPHRVTISPGETAVVARDEETGVTSQGETKAEALANLAEALELHERPSGADDDLDPADAPWFDEE